MFAMLPKIEKVATDFAAVSTDNFVRGCAGCIDGFLAITKRPTTKAPLLWPLWRIWFTCAGSL